MKVKVYQKIARTLTAYLNCVNADEYTEWERKHLETLEELVKDTAPSGSGIDCGTTINIEKSKPDNLVFDFSYHHMDEHGGYNGWTKHTCIVRPCLSFGIDIKITGRDRNQIKDYLYDVYSTWLNSEVEEH